MKTPKDKHMRFEDRLRIQEMLDNDCSFTQIGKAINKDRTTVSREVINHRYCRKATTDKNPDCELLEKAPYVCNACDKRAICRKNRFIYEASIAENEYKHTLSETRSILQISKDQISDINQMISPLMIEQHHSVNQLYANHKELLPFSKVTFYRYIDLVLFNVRNIDLQRKVRFKVKKEYDTSRVKTDPKIKLDRFYTDFQDYTELHPDASVVEMDTVIGTAGGKGGKCFLTLFFRSCKLMLIRLLPYKKAQYVNAAFDDLKSTLGDSTYRRFFAAILTDNGTEFSDPDRIESDPLNSAAEKMSHLFYCDPNCSWQKGSIEKNHEYIRYILPKGTSFAGLTQDDCDLLASHINYVPRLSLNNSTPYDLALSLLGKEVLDKLNIRRIEPDDVILSPALLKKH